MPKAIHFTMKCSVVLNYYTLCIMDATIYVCAYYIVYCKKDRIYNSSAFAFRWWWRFIDGRFWRKQMWRQNHSSKQCNLHYSPMPCSSDYISSYFHFTFDIIIPFVNNSNNRLLQSGNWFQFRCLLEHIQPFKPYASSVRWISRLKAFYWVGFKFKNPPVLWF